MQDGNGFLAKGGLKSCSVAKRSLASKEISRLRVLVTADDVELAMQGEREGLADGRLSGSGFADEEDGLVAMEAGGDEVVEAAHGVGPDEVGGRRGFGEASFGEAGEVVERDVVDNDLHLLLDYGLDDHLVLWSTSALSEKHVAVLGELLVAD